MRFAARLLGVLIAFLLVLFVSKTSFAQTNPDVPKNLHTYTQNVMLEVMSSMICQLAGVDPINPNQKCLGVDHKTGRIGFVENGGGAIGVTGSLIAGTFLIPVHFSDYATYAVNNFGFPKKSYAQDQDTGIGYTGLQPVVRLFTIFRNIAYLLMVFIFVIIGVAIMLRVRIDPRTVMTIQNQIPKLVIGVIMITFSYAIVGLLIDAMWISTYFVINTLTPTGQRKLVTEGITLGAPGFADKIYFDKGGLLKLSFDAAAGVGDVVGNMIDPDENPAYKDLLESTRPDCGWDPLCAIGQFLDGTLGDLVAGIVATILNIAARIIVLFIFIIAILVALFKLLFALLKSFITILLDTILAPFWILGGLLPGAGQNIGLGPWLRDVVANLAVFPAVVFLFLVARVIMDGLQKTTVTCTPGSTTCLTFNPPLIGNATADSANFGALIAVGFILAAPGVVESVKKAFKASGGVGLGGAAVGAAAAGALGGAIGSRLYYRWRDPATGQMRSGGVAAYIQQNVTSGISNSGVGQRVGNLTRPIRKSRVVRKVGGWFKPPLPRSDEGTTSQPTTEDTNRARREQADRE